MEAHSVREITAGQQAWLERIHKAVGTPFGDLHYGIGHKGSARMALNGLVFVVDRDTNRVSLECYDPNPRRDLKDEMIWRDEHGLDGSYEAVVGSYLDAGDIARKRAKGE